MKLKKILAVVSIFAVLGVGIPCEKFNVLNDFTVLTSAETLENGLSYKVNKDGTGIEITDCDATVTSIEIPAEIDGLPVTSIKEGYYGQGVFSNCTLLTSVTIPESITSIGICAFDGCTSLTSITIPESVTNIGYYVFSNCSSLTEIIIPNSVTSIDSSAFDGCTSLTSITIPDSVTSIGDRAFSGCTSLKSITIPDSITSIGYDAFSGTPFLENQPTDVKYASKWVVDCDENITEIELKSDTVGIADGTFSRCEKITSITIPNSVISIGGYAFSGCTSLKSIIIPNSVTSIGNRAFLNCSSLTSVSIPDSVTSIGECVFFNTSLKEIQIPSSVIYLDYAFAGYYTVENFMFDMPRSEEPWTVNMSKRYDKVEDFTIYGYTGSIVEIYANVNGFNFVSIGTMPSEQPTGDIDSDGETTSNDALNILQIVANAGEFTEEQKAFADIDGNGEINSYDALLVLQMIVGL